MDDKKPEVKEPEEIEGREIEGFQVTEEEIEIALKKVLQGMDW
jgi:hypothetical protein